MFILEIKTIFYCIFEKVKYVGISSVVLRKKFSAPEPCFVFTFLLLEWRVVKLILLAVKITVKITVERPTSIKRCM
ncbi:hypothetical protein VNO78_17828 [Psophocarpus tetragonolobus]|uniref:Uncharacterized protein n=1 Tax=Psophocarpus tetragonolobus TaxID=3891 RepID=A0AAN9XLL5_PSOTE